jgi:hypothetical protein
VKQPRFYFERETQIADDLHAALTRLDAALARTQISSAEHRRRIDAIGSWLQQRGFLSGLERGTLYDAWTIRRC